MADESGKLDGIREQEGSGKKDENKHSSPGVLGGIFFVLLGGGIGIFFLMSSLKAGPAQKSFVDDRYAEVDLEVVQRELPAESALRFHVSFVCNPVLILNPDIENIDQVNGLVEMRKKSLRGELIHLLYRLSDLFFHRPNLMQRISDLFLETINASLGPLENGKPIISRIVFSRFETPSR